MVFLYVLSLLFVPRCPFCCSNNANVPHCGINKGVSHLELLAVILCAEICRSVTQHAHCFKGDEIEYEPIYLPGKSAPLTARVQRHFQPHELTIAERLDEYKRTTPLCAEAFPAGAERVKSDSACTERPSLPPSSLPPSLPPSSLPLHPFFFTLSVCVCVCCFRGACAICKPSALLICTPTKFDKQTAPSRF